MNKNKDRDRETILSFIEKNGIIDKDIRIPGKPSSPGKTCRKHSARVVLDLHGMKCEDAARKVRSFINQSRERGIREILIVHGRGNHSAVQGEAVLKKMVRDMLERELQRVIRDFRTALPKDGGDGATLVYLR